MIKIFTANLNDVNYLRREDKIDTKMHQSRWVSNVLVTIRKHYIIKDGSLEVDVFEVELEKTRELMPLSWTEVKVDMYKEIMELAKKGVQNSPAADLRNGVYTDSYHEVFYFVRNGKVHTKIDTISNRLEHNPTVYSKLYPLTKDQLERKKKEWAF